MTASSPKTDSPLDAGARPWLSLLIPVYNVAEWLPACMDSIAAQDCDGVEVLFLDDCATDDSRTLAEDWVLAQPQINAKVLRHERNQGISVSRNDLLEASRGEYVWFIDSDDALRPGSIKSLRQVIEQHPVDLVLCDFAYLRARPRLKHRLRGEHHVRTYAGDSRQPSSDTASLLSNLLVLGYLHSWSKIARRTLWGDDLRFPVGRAFEDMATSPDVAARARSFVHVPEVWVDYRQRAGSILASASLQKTDDMMHALHRLPQRLQRVCDGHADVRFAASHFAARSFIGAARFASRKGDTARVARYREEFLAALCLAPEALMAQYLRKGWWWRALRLRHWLKRSAHTTGA